MRRRGFVCAAVLTMIVSLTATAPVWADNPIVTDIYTADPAALVHDGRMYIYTGRDEATPTQNNFVMREWHAFSSDNPSQDPDAWEHHGALLSIDDFAWADANAWAAEVVEGPDGRFYWFVSLRRANAPPGDVMSIGVAVGDTPLGPFEDAIGGPLITGEMSNSSSHNIDPTVIVDDEHGIWMYWGSFWSARMAKLKDNMIELESGILPATGMVTGVLPTNGIMTPQGLNLFWEAPWIFEKDGVYYNAYASNQNMSGDGCVTAQTYACIRYATSGHPGGPWTHQGIVLGQLSSTTNHPAIVEFEGEWWMVYHTADAPGGGNFRRSVAIDRLFWNPDGTMQQVVQTPIPGEDEPEATDNAALSAVATCSYTSPWESCAAINDGIDPPQSNDNQNPRWGTWPNTGTHWIQLNWASPVRVDASEVYWFQDSADGSNSGVKRPASWSMQYWDGEQYVDVSNPSGYGTALNQYNRTTFDEVTTTRLRATLQTRSDAAGVGALEWKVYSVPPASVDLVEVTTDVGMSPALPETVTLRYDDGDALEAGVWWRPFDEALLDAPGSFTVTGVIEGVLVEAVASVQVVGDPTGPPGPVRDLGATPAPAAIQLAWDAPRFHGGSPLSGFRVYRDGALLVDLAADARSYTDDDLAEGDTHTYVVRSYNDDGEGPHETVTATVPSRPDPPASVAAGSGPGIGEITVTWSPPASDGGLLVTSYRVYRDGQPVREVPAVIRRFVDTDRTPATAYTYHVTAVNAVGPSDPSQTSCATASPSVSQLQNLVCS